MMRRKGKIILGVVCAVLLIAIGGGWWYIADDYSASPAAVLALSETDEAVRIVIEEGSIAFIPVQPTTGIIFYPGGKVHSEAYAPLMRKCAEKGLLCVIMKMPANLAVLKPSAADGVISKYSEVAEWYMAGHSLGGAMAANYAGGHVSEFRGLILLAAYAAEDISESGLKVLSIYGTEDQVLNRNSYEKYRKNLPDGYVERILEGGCHAYFGDYGAQDGDGTPMISCEEQMRQTAECIAAFVGL